jgi:CDP-glycerol glycerophosphotransferase (TagB/SpsB family)
MFVCETWSLTLTEKYRKNKFENRALREIFGSKKDWEKGDRRRLNMGNYDLCCSLNVSRMIKSIRRGLMWGRGGEGGTRHD